MNDEYIRQGETFEVTLTDDDTTADNVVLTISNDDGQIVASAEADYQTVDDQRVATITLTEPSLEVGEYSYMYTITYSDNHVEKLPDVSEDDCSDGSCELPKFIVCVANDISGS